MSNLPPGCRVSDIPGNRPEDERYERDWEMIHERLRARLTPYYKDLVRLKTPLELLTDEVMAIVYEARAEATKDALDHPRCTACGGSGVIPRLSDRGEEYPLEPSMCLYCHGEGYR